MRTMSKKLIFAMFATGALLSGCATEAGLIDTNLVAEGDAGIFDADRDGLIERNEFAAFGSKNFASWDRNADSWLSEEEFNLGWEAIGFEQDVEVFNAFDNDENDYLDGDEFFGEEGFDSWDTDRDGILADDEWRL